MAIEPRNLIQENNVGALKKIYATHVEPKPFGNGAIEVELAPGTVVAYETTTNTWKEWVNGGPNGLDTIRGIVWPNPVKIAGGGGGERIGNVMLRGRAHITDLLTSGGTTSELIAAIRSQTPSLRELGIDIEGLAQVR